MNETNPQSSGSEFNSRVDLKDFSQNVSELKKGINQVLVGQQKAIDLLLVALLANGHVLLEGVPGIAKTLTAKLLARTLTIPFSRLQFTPDLMPSDVLGTSVYNLKTTEFEFKPGPVFSNLVLVDEINRAPAKTQAALFEVMEERQVTIDGNTHPMQEPYMVVATQNPIEQEGTYRLPEAQLDRFLFKVTMHYPSLDNEVAILEQALSPQGLNPNKVQPVLSQAQILDLKALIPQIHVEKPVLSYMAQMVEDTRKDPSIYLGASPRASVALLRGSQAFAALQGRDFVTPEDVQFLAEPVLNHRIIITPEREMEGTTVAEVVQQIVKKIEVPR
jgi:MoxR-like ATPase